jgi:hypothetical protein
MDNLEPQPLAPKELSLGELQAQFESLRGLIVSMLILLVVLAGVFDLYLLRQVQFTRGELKAVRPQATQMIADYSRNFEPGMKDFIRKLQEFARTHPDFAPVLAKYGIKPAQTPVLSPATTAPGIPQMPGKK